MKHLFLNKKAVSPVVGTVLMILVVMAGMTILFGFVGSYSASFQAGTGSAVLESLTVENSWFNTSQTGNPQLVLWVYNVGKIDCKINAVYLNGTSATPGMFDSNNNPINPANAITVGEHFQIIIPTVVGLADASYVVKIATIRGSAFEGVYSP